MRKIENLKKFNIISYGNFSNNNNNNNNRKTRIKNDFGEYNINKSDINKNGYSEYDEKKTISNCCDYVKNVPNDDDNIISTDPNGAYTGVPLNPNEKPVQDADDL